MRVNILKFVEATDTEDMDKQKSFNGDVKENGNQGVSQNIAGSKIEGNEQKETSYFIFYYKNKYFKLIIQYLILIIIMLNIF